MARANASGSSRSAVTPDRAHMATRPPEVRGHDGGSTCQRLIDDIGLPSPSLASTKASAAQYQSGRSPFGTVPTSVLSYLIRPH